MPTRSGVATLAIGVLALVSGRVFGIFELYIVAGVLLALVACAMAWVTLNRRSLDVSRSVAPARLHVGSTSVITLLLENRRMLPTPVAQVTDEVGGEPRADAHVPPLGRNKVTRASYRVLAEQRGRIPLGPMRTRVTDPFALATTVRSSAPDTSVLVLPRYDRIAPPPQPSGAVGVRPDRAPGRIGQHGEEFSSLRSYVQGDDLRKVHWPSTARVDELVVRTEHVPEHGDSLVVLDVRSLFAAPDTFERMVSAATSVLMACFERGDRLRLKTTVGTDMTADDRSGFDRILDFLALVEQVRTDTAEIASDRGRSTESAVLVIGSSDAFVDALGPQNALPDSTFVLQFVDVGARSTASNAALPSRRMAVLGPDDELPLYWSALIGVRGRPRTDVR